MEPQCLEGDESVSIMQQREREQSLDALYESTKVICKVLKGFSLLKKPLMENFIFCAV